MFTRNKPNEEYFEEGIWQKATTPQINVLRQLANKLLSEVESIKEGGRFNFGDGFNLSAQVQKFEIDMIRYALYLSRGRQTVAARMLGLKMTTLNAKIKRYGING